MDRPVIVHISGDFPDCIAPNKTRAITNLVEATSEFDHIVYSLNRVPAWGGIESVQFSNNKIALGNSAGAIALCYHFSRIESATLAKAPVGTKTQNI
jgi:hypothetical protein